MNWTMMPNHSVGLLTHTLQGRGWSAVLAAVMATLLVASSLGVSVVAPCLAAVYRVPSDAALIRKADVIVRGRVESARSFREPAGGLSTDIEIGVERVLKGGRLPARIFVRQPGGALGSEIEVYPGIGTFAPRERVLLMLTRSEVDGVFTLTDFAIGKFHVAPARGGEILVRDDLAGADVVGRDIVGRDIVGRDGAGRAGQEGAQEFSDPDRDAVRFERFIAAAARGGSPRADYLLPRGSRQAGERAPADRQGRSRASGAAGSARASAAAGAVAGAAEHLNRSDRRAGMDRGTVPARESGFTWLGEGEVGPFRRLEFDDGNQVVYKDNPAGDAGSLCQPGGCHDRVATGIARWNAATGARILLAYGGSDPAIGGACRGALVDQIQFGDPCHEIADLINCSGTLAISGFRGTMASGGSPSCPAKGNPSFARITSGHILINNGAGSCLQPCEYIDMIAHSVGHTLGAGHSDDQSAVMFPFIIQGVCGVLGADDVAFAQCFHPHPCSSPCLDSDPCTRDRCNQETAQCEFPPAVPSEAANLTFLANKETLTWSAGEAASPATGHDVARGLAAELPVGSGASESCLASAISDPTTDDPSAPAAGRTFWYLARSRNACGTGSYGAASDGTPRSSPVCP